MFSVSVSLRTRRKPKQWDIKTSRKAVGTLRASGKGSFGFQWDFGVARTRRISYRAKDYKLSLPAGTTGWLFDYGSRDVRSAQTSKSVQALPVVRGALSLRALGARVANPIYLEYL